MRFAHFNFNDQCKYIYFFILSPCPKLPCPLTPHKIFLISAYILQRFKKKKKTSITQPKIPVVVDMPYSFLCLLKTLNNVLYSRNFRFLDTCTCITIAEMLLKYLTLNLISFGKIDIWVWNVFVLINMLLMFQALLNNANEGLKSLYCRLKFVQAGVLATTATYS